MNGELKAGDFVVYNNPHWKTKNTIFVFHSKSCGEYSILSQEDIINEWGSKYYRNSNFSISSKENLQKLNMFKIGALVVDKNGRPFEVKTGTGAHKVVLQNIFTKKIHHYAPEDFKDWRPLIIKVGQQWKTSKGVVYTLDNCKNTWGAPCGLFKDYEENGPQSCWHYIFPSETPKNLHNISLEEFDAIAGIRLGLNESFSLVDSKTHSEEITSTTVNNDKLIYATSDNILQNEITSAPLLFPQRAVDNEKFTTTFHNLQSNIEKLRALRDGSYAEKYWEISWARVGLLLAALLSAVAVGYVTAPAWSLLFLIPLLSLFYLTRDKSWDRWSRVADKAKIF